MLLTILPVIIAMWYFMATEASMYLIRRLYTGSKLKAFGLKSLACVSSFTLFCLTYIGLTVITGPIYS